MLSALMDVDGGGPPARALRLIPTKALLIFDILEFVDTLVVGSDDAEAM